MASGKWKRRSLYCPLDLFSGWASCSSLCFCLKTVDEPRTVTPGIQVSSWSLFQETRGIRGGDLLTQVSWSLFWKAVLLTRGVSVCFLNIETGFGGGVGCFRVLFPLFSQLSWSGCSLAVFVCGAGTSRGWTLLSSTWSKNLRTTSKFLRWDTAAVGVCLDKGKQLLHSADVSKTSVISSVYSEPEDLNPGCVELACSPRTHISQVCDICSGWTQPSPAAAGLDSSIVLL